MYEAARQTDGSANSAQVRAWAAICCISLSTRLDTHVVQVLGYQCAKLLECQSIVSPQSLSVTGTRLLQLNH